MNAWRSASPSPRNAVVVEAVAEARVRIDQLCSFVLRTACLINTLGAKGAANEISAIKIAAPDTAQWVVDKAIQLHGAGGLTEDYPLAMLWTQSRGLRFASGPEGVHRMALGRRELNR